MRGRKTALTVLLSEQEHQQLPHGTRSTTMPVGLVQRAHTVRLAAEGVPLSHIAQKVGLAQKHVRQWVTRFLQDRMAGLQDRPGRGRKPSFSPSGRPARRQDRL